MGLGGRFMRILYVHQYFTTPEGATGTRSYEFARRLLARGHQVTMLCASYKVSKTGLSGPFAKGRREGNVDGIDVVEFQLEFSNRTSLPQRAIVFLRFAWRSIKMALREDYDLIFATSTPLTAAIPGIAQKWFGRRKRPFVFEIRDPWPEAPRDMGLIKNRAVL
ncbi:MAG: glycosyltransferase, partial [Fimbriimonadaceae bacterium]